MHILYGTEFSRSTIFADWPSQSFRRNNFRRWRAFAVLVYYTYKLGVAKRTSDLYAVAVKNHASVLLSATYLERYQRSALYFCGDAAQLCANLQVTGECQWIYLFQEQNFCGWRSSAKNAKIMLLKNLVYTSGFVYCIPSNRYSFTVHTALRRSQNTRSK